MTHPDTTFFVSAIQPGSPQEAQLNAWFFAQESLGISSVAWAEFFCGLLSAREESIDRHMFTTVEVLSASDAELAASLFNKTVRRSKTLADYMIAAVAIRCGATLATVNKGDFQPFVQNGLVIA